MRAEEWPAALKNIFVAVDAGLCGDHAVDHGRADRGVRRDLSLAQPRAVSGRHVKAWQRLLLLCSLLHFSWQRQRVAGVGRLIDRRRQVLERVAASDDAATPRTTRRRSPPAQRARSRPAPIFQFNFASTRVSVVHESFLLVRQRRRLAEFLRALQFRRQLGEQVRPCPA